MNILFIDKNKAVLKMYKRMIEPLTYYNAYFATSVEATLDYLKVIEVSIIVSNICAPTLDGVELFTYVHKMYPQIVRLVLTENYQKHQSTTLLNNVHSVQERPKTSEDMYLLFEYFKYLIPCT